MSRALGPRTIAGPNAGAWAVLGLAWGTVGLIGLAWVAAWLAARVAGRHIPPLGVAWVAALLHGRWIQTWPGVSSALVLTVAGLQVAAGTATTVSVSRAIQRRRPAVDDPLRSLARPADVAPLTPGGVAARARSLRPSLAGRTRLAAGEAGWLLGDLEPHGPELRAGVEEVAVAVMGPRTGKTASLAVPTIRHAPGAVMATSNKADLRAATAAGRATAGRRVWVFDPQRVVHAEQTWWWDPLQAIDGVEEANRLAGHFVQEIIGGTRLDGADFWTAAARDLLTELLLAAAVSGRTMLDVYSWLNDTRSPVPASLLEHHGYPVGAVALRGRQHGASETREGVYETARTAAQCLLDDQITAWVTPPARPLEQLLVADFAGSGGTLYLLSKDGSGAAAPLVAGMVDQILRAAVRQAERGGGRLDPQLTVVLDEAANVCKIADLPLLYSHFGSRLIQVLTILQSYRQGVGVWGEQGMDSLWSAATVKLVGAGVDDARFAEDISRLVGEHDIPLSSLSRSRDGVSESVSLRRQRILEAAAIRALRKGTALLLASGCRPALIRLRPWYAEPGAEQIAAAVRLAEQSIKDRTQVDS
jgi:type IV secretory pathway TraG/TraD family ATPase VirD4